MAFPFMLLAAQAAGIGANLYSQRRQARAENRALDQQAEWMDVGLGMQMGDLSLEMEQDTLASTEQSLFNMEQLRETMAAQRAIFGARGQMPGVGSANSVANKSINTFNSDESARETNKKINKFKLESKGRLLKINNITGKAGLSNQKAMGKSKRQGERLSQGLNMFNFNQVFGN